MSTDLSRDSALRNTKARDRIESKRGRSEKAKNSIRGSIAAIAVCTNRNR